MSPYNYAANNPISIIDIFGDELEYEMNTNNPDKLAYVSIGLNGFQNADGTAYSGEVNDAMKSVMKDINIMKLTPIGYATVSHLISSKNKYTIFQNEKNNFDPDKGTDKAGMTRATWIQFASANPYDSSYMLKNDPTLCGGTGGRIGYNPKGHALPEEGRMKNRPSIVLFHEFRHAMDADIGLMNYDFYLGIEGNEWRTCYFETIYRMQLKDLGLPEFEGIGRRSHYEAETIKGSPLLRPSGTSLFDKDNNPYIPEQFR